MPNKSYQYSANKERQVKQDFEKEGWFSARTSGSHGIADVIAIKPTKCGHADHFQVRFIQIKTSITRKNFKINHKVEESTCGPINVEWWEFPHRRNNMS